MKANNTTYTETITEVEAITGAKVVAITKEDSAFNSDFVLLDNDGEITQAFFTRDINGKISVNACYGSNSIPEALTYLNMSEEELSQNIEFINPNNTTPETTETMNEQTKQYFRYVYGSYENLCEQANERLATLRYELQEYYNNASKGGKDRAKNMRWLKEDIKKLEQQKKECKQAFEVEAVKTMQEIENQAVKLTQKNWKHFNGNSSINVSETAKALRTSRDKLINKAYLNAAAKHLTTKAKAISEFLSVKPMHEAFCVMLDYNTPAVGMALKVASPFCVESLLNNPDKVSALINA